MVKHLEDTSFDGDDQQTPEPEEHEGEPQQQERERPEADDAEAHDEQRQVPYARFDEVNRGLKEARRQAEEERRRAELTENRFQQLFQAWQQGQQQAQPQQQAEPEPEQPPVAYEDDPAGFIRWQQEQDRKWFERELQPLKQAYQQQTQISQEQQQRRQILDDLKKIQDSYNQHQPDYYDVVNAWTRRQVQDLVRMGIPEHYAAEKVANDQVATAVYIAQQGKNPAEVAYEVAKQYASAAPQPQKSNGRDMERRAAGLEQSRSLSGMAGSSGKKDGGPDKLANMSSEEFAAFKAKFQAEQSRKGLPADDKTFFRMMG